MTDESASILKNTYNVKTIVPLDILLGIQNLPFKVSTGMMLEIAYRAVKLSSYQDAENYFLRTKNISISNDTIRKIVKASSHIQCAERPFSLRIVTGNE